MPLKQGSAAGVTAWYSAHSLYPPIVLFYQATYCIYRQYYEDNAFDVKCGIVPMRKFSAEITLFHLRIVFFFVSTLSIPPSPPLAVDHIGKIV